MVVLVSSSSVLLLVVCLRWYGWMYVASAEEQNEDGENGKNGQKFRTSIHDGIGMEES